VVLKCPDPDNDLITIQSRQDIQVALQHLIVAFQRQVQASHVPDLLQKHGLPPLKVIVVPVASASLEPRPPPSELAEIGKTVRARDLGCAWTTTQATGCVGGALTRS
jgi:hypothetical protein